MTETSNAGLSTDSVGSRRVQQVAATDDLKFGTDSFLKWIRNCKDDEVLILGLAIIAAGTIALFVSSAVRSRLQPSEEWAWWSNRKTPGRVVLLQAIGVAGVTFGGVMSELPLLAFIAIVIGAMVVSLVIPTARHNARLNTSRGADNTSNGAPS